MSRSIPPEALAEFQRVSGHTFANPALLREALTHKSLLQESLDAAINQRLEFLGDAVVQLIVTDALYELFPSEREGPLSRFRSTLTRGGMLAQLARELGMPHVLLVSDAEAATGGLQREAAMEDALEAVVGAIYLDAGIEVARARLLAWYGPLQRRIAAQVSQHNPKGQLQELVQPRHGNHALRYSLVATEGQAHSRRFTCAVHLLDQHLGTGTGTSKKSAEEEAARAAIEELRRRPELS